MGRQPGQFFCAGRRMRSSRFLQDWFATVQLVLQALWQEALHSPHPVCAPRRTVLAAMVTMCFICTLSSKKLMPV